VTGTSAPSLNAALDLLSWVIDASASPENFWFSKA
jgi:hypothetical protein